MARDYKQSVGAFAVIFSNEKKILLGQRNDPTRPYSHGTWNIPGGIVEFDENPSDTASKSN